MTYFGLISAPWPLTILAYIGTFGPLGLGVWLLWSDGLEQLHVWWADRVPGKTSTEPGHHRVQEVRDGQ